MEDLAQKFAAFKDGPEKTALAMQIFGRAGAEMVPLLNRGKNGIADFIAEATKLGLVISADDAAAAKQFEESMNKIEGAAKGAANRITAEMLPSLQKLMANMKTSAEDSTTLFNQLAQVIPTVGKAFIVAFGFVQTMLDELESHIKEFGSIVVTVFGELGSASSRLLHGHAGEAKIILKEMKDEITQIDHDGAVERTKIWQEYTNGVSEFWNAKITKLATPGGSKDKPDAPSTPDANAGKAQEAIAKRISDLEKQATAEIMVAAAQDRDTAATMQAIAAAQAKEFIDKANADLTQKKAGHLSASQKASILAAESEKVFAAAARDTSKSLAETATKTGEQTNAVTAMSAAYSKGGAAIAQAQEAAQIAPFQKKVDDLALALDKLKASNPGATKEITAMSAALHQAQSELTAVKAAFDEYDSAQRKSNTDRLATDTERQIASTQSYTDALLKGVEALRQYDINQKLIDYQNNSTFDQSTEAVQRYRKQIEDLYTAQDLRAAADRLHSVDRQGDLNKEIALLEQLRSKIVANGGSTLAIDAAIHSADMQRRQDLNNQLLQTNSIKNGFKVFWDEYANSGVTAAQRVNQFMNQTMNNFTSTLSKALVEGKADWRGFATTAIESLVEIGIQEMIAHFARRQMNKEDRMDNAKAVFGNVYKALSGIPIVGPVLAPVAASAAFATVMAFREGGIVPGDGNDGVPALLHPREMVLPERVAKTVTDNVRSGGDGGPGKAPHYHYSPVVHLPPGGDPKEFSRQLDEHHERWYKAQARKHGLKF
jgi:hypothetical protein